MLVFGLLFTGILSRFIFHAPNFTPVVALALFGGTYLKKKQALVLPWALMFLSDMVIGFHNMMFFTYGSVLLIAMVGLWVKERKSAAMVMGASLASAILFFIVTNFGSWMVMYPHTLRGLQQCYIAAIPFFRYTLFSTLVYSGVFFGLYELAAYFLRNTRYARFLLAA